MTCACSFTGPLFCLVVTGCLQVQEDKPAKKEARKKVEKRPQSRTPSPRRNAEWDALFHDLDINHDGTLTKSEVLKRLRTSDDSLLERFSRILHLPKKLQSQDGSLAKFEKMFKQMDTDNDRRVTLKEFRDYVAELEPSVRYARETWGDVNATLD